MNKRILTLAIGSSILFAACNGTASENNATNVADTTTTTTPAVVDSTVTQTLTDKDGNQLDMVFNNASNTVSITFKGETAELDGQKAASGIWYKNDTFELSGKANDIQLKKNGKLVFEHLDDKVEIVSKNDKGEVLNMTFNNTEGTVKAYLNGGEQIDLVAQKAASGIWYKNDHYELSGKGDHYELKKDGQTVYKN